MMNGNSGNDNSRGTSCCSHQSAAVSAKEEGRGETATSGNHKNNSCESSSHNSRSNNSHSNHDASSGSNPVSTLTPPSASAQQAESSEGSGALSPSNQSAHNRREVPDCSSVPASRLEAAGVDENPSRVCNSAAPSVRSSSRRSLAVVQDPSEVLAGGTSTRAEEKQIRRSQQRARLLPRSRLLKRSASGAAGSAISKQQDENARTNSHSSHHSSLGNSTLSTKSVYQLFGGAVNPAKLYDYYDYDDLEGHHRKGDHSYYSRTSSAGSSFFYRFGWYGAVTGVGGFWLACATLVCFLTLLTFVTAKAVSAESGSAGASNGNSFLVSTLSSVGGGFMSSAPPPPPLRVVVATRLHNRQASHAMTDDAVRHKIRDFAKVCQMADAVQGIIAVDAEDAQLIRQVRQEIEASPVVSLHALPITPWGRFVPALNALIGYAASAANMPDETMADAILFVSAETTATRQSIQMLMHHMLEQPSKEEQEHESILTGLARLRTSKVTSSSRHHHLLKLDNSTLVVGARLAGHDYQNKAERSTEEDEGAATSEAQVVELNGRTTPWNTLALWNLRKLATTGFLLMSEGYLTTEEEPSFGVEEVVTIALLQQLLGADQAQAKLVPVPGVSWDADFADPDRQRWHETKMESKKSRADRQMKMAKLSGVVHHY